MEFIGGIDKQALLSSDRQKRRSRNDPSGRDFKCQVCDRTYLSYPAMYTHMKNKHALDPNGTHFSNQAHRSRGRPKRLQEYNRVDPTSEIYLRSEGRGGGPNNPISGFKEGFLQVYGGKEGENQENRKYQEHTDHPMFDSINKYQFEQTPGYDPDEEPTNQRDEPLEENSKGYQYRQLSRDIATMSEEWRVMMNCDEIFSIYLREAAEKTNEQFYHVMVKFILYYRECLNEYGWQKRAEAECRETRQTLEEKNIQARLFTYKDLMSQHEFCVINNAEVLPEVCNEFITIYLDTKKDACGVQKEDAIDYTRHLCHWLFINGHTCSKLSMINP